MSIHQGIRRVLVALDGSELAEQAIPFAAALTKGGGEIVLLHVAPSAEPVRDLLGRVAVQTDEIEDVSELQGKEELQAAASQWKSLLESEPRIEIVIGDPATEIIAAAERLECDLIVAASHGRGAVGRLAFGSVADRITRSATIPVLIIRPQDADPEIELPRIERIVVPYDGSELAAESFPVAVTLARSLGVSIHLVRAITPSAYAPIPTPMEPYYAPEAFAEIIDDIEDEAQQSLETAKATLEADGVGVSYELTTGTAFDAVTERAQAGDVIVMTSHGRSGVQRWLLGSVSEKLVREGPSPVVLVPSAGRAELTVSEETT